MEPENEMFRGRSKYLVEHETQSTGATSLTRYFDLPRNISFLGSILSSDMWRAYGGVRAMPQRFRHWTVNHRYHFVDPVNRRAHSQGVENLWSQWKARVRRLYGIHDPQYKDHINEFTWHQRFGRIDERLHKFWAHVAEVIRCNHYKSFESPERDLKRPAGFYPNGPL